MLGNTGDARFVPVLARALNDAEPLVRGATAWALGRIGGEAAAEALRRRAAIEDNPDVRAELVAAFGEQEAS